MEQTALERQLRRGDWFILGLFCMLLYGYLIVDTRVLSTHETVHCQNVREMLADHDWIIPHYGGRPWLERPPLPHWITAAVVSITGTEREWGYRLSTALVALLILALVASTAAMWYGRTIGLLTGLILASMSEFEHYATGPEADMFLCLLVTTALCLFARLEFARRPAGPGEGQGFLGRRPWPVLAFFILLGLTNVAKGLFFGSIFVALPVTGYLLGNRQWSALRRYVWLWGWLACLVAASAWAVAAWLRLPDVVELWKSDYLGRLNQGYLREPSYYYLAILPQVLSPWLLPALVGLFGPAGQRVPRLGTPERFLWCWALIPVAFFSIPQGKHHHYLLQCIAPWAVLAALGTVRIWDWICQAPAWFRHPATGVALLAVPLDAALVLFRHKLPGPSWMIPTMLVAIPLAVAFTWWAVNRGDARLALAAVLGLFLAGHYLESGYCTHYRNSYKDDLNFVTEVRQQAAAAPGVPLMVVADKHPLNASWMLFYLGNRAALLHNSTFLCSDKLQGPEVFLVAVAGEEESLRQYGIPEWVAQSSKSRYETTPAERWTLFRLRFHEKLARHTSNVSISPMQATGRAPGPYMH